MCFLKSQMPETCYRASRFCRVLGNPTAYLILKCLEGRRLTVSEISALTGITVSTISMTLRHLRQVDAVRYETSCQSKVYWLKISDVTSVMQLIEDLMDEMRLVMG